MKANGLVEPLVTGLKIMFFGLSTDARNSYLPAAARYTPN